jgi:mannose-6-phosphate isomerase-like protein (cupin superfamily)
VDPIQPTLYATGERAVRPWGTWAVLACETTYVVKEIVVLPGARLSLQRHRFRQETWVVIQGTAEVTVGTATFISAKGATVTIPTGAPHRLANVGTDPLIVIEVQQGQQLTEDDIERLADDYGRA